MADETSSPSFMDYASGLTPIAALGFNIMQNQQNLKQQKRAYEDSKNIEAQRWYERRQWDMEDWDKQNRYNSPEMQMARFKAAGLNPHLIYGQGRETSPIRGGGTSSGPNLKAPQSNIDTNLIAESGPRMQQGLMMTAQTDNLKAQNELIQLQAQAQALDNQSKQLDIQYKQEDRPYHLNVQKLDIQGRQTDISLKDTQEFLAREENQYHKDANNRAAEQQKYIIYKLQSETSVNLEQKKRLVQEWLKLEYENTPTFRKSQRDMLLASIANAQNTANISKVELSLEKQGVSKHDPLYMKLYALKLNGVNTDNLMGFHGSVEGLKTLGKIGTAIGVGQALKPQGKFQSHGSGQLKRKTNDWKNGKTYEYYK